MAPGGPPDDFPVYPPSSAIQSVMRPTVTTLRPPRLAFLRANTAEISSSENSSVAGRPGAVREIHIKRWSRIATVASTNERT